MCARLACGVYDGIVGFVRTKPRDVLANCAGQEPHGLRQIADVLPKCIRIILIERRTIQPQ